MQLLLSGRVVRAVPHLGPDLGKIGVFVNPREHVVLQVVRSRDLQFLLGRCGLRPLLLQLLRLDNSDLVRDPCLKRTLECPRIGEQGAAREAAFFIVKSDQLLKLV